MKRTFWTKKWSKKYFLPTYLPYFIIFLDRYWKQTISFLGLSQIFLKILLRMGKSRVWRHVLSPCYLPGCNVMKYGHGYRGRHWELLRAPRAAAACSDVRIPLTPAAWPLSAASQPVTSLNPHADPGLGLKKKLFVSCNPTLTSFYSKISLPKVFTALQTPNQRKTCIKHTFLTKKIMQWKIFFYRPTYPFFFT